MFFTKLIHLLSCCCMVVLLFAQQRALAFSPPGALLGKRSHNNKPSFVRSQIATQRYNLLDSLGSMIQNFGKKARASHILIAPRDWDSEEEARQKLIRLKDEINNDPEKFAEAAKRISSCPSSKKGGDLGEFGPGMMVRNFDKVCFNEDVGVVHGPISTQFGEHLILITERTGEN